LSYQAYLSMVNTVGIDRAADWLYGDMKAARQFFDQMPINANEKEKIAHLNAERLLGLVRINEARLLAAVEFLADSTQARARILCTKKKRVFGWKRLEDAERELGKINQRAEAKAKNA